MRKEMDDTRAVSPNELLYLPEEQREFAAQLLNRGSGTSCHGVVNAGKKWHVPAPDGRFFAGVLGALDKR